MNAKWVFLAWTMGFIVVMKCVVSLCMMSCSRIFMFLFLLKIFKWLPESFDDWLFLTVPLELGFLTKSSNTGVYTRKTCQLYLYSFIYSACSGQGLGLTDHMNWCLLGKVRSTLRPTLIPFFYSRINTTLCFHSTKFYMTMSIFLTSMRILTKNSAQNY